MPHVIRSIFPNLSSVPVLGPLATRQFVIALCTICVSYPLSLHRDIAKLSRASGLALVGMIGIVTSVLFDSARVAPKLQGPLGSRRRTLNLKPGLPRAVGVISFAYVCHHTPTLDLAAVTHVSAACSLAACLALAFSAFRVFTSKT